MTKIPQPGMVFVGYRFQSEPFPRLVPVYEPKPINFKQHAEAWSDLEDPRHLKFYDVRLGVPYEPNLIALALAWEYHRDCEAFDFANDRRLWSRHARAKFNEKLLEFSYRQMEAENLRFRNGEKQFEITIPDPNFIRDQFKVAVSEVGRRFNELLQSKGLDKVLDTPNPYGGYNPISFANYIEDERQRMVDLRVARK